MNEYACHFLDRDTITVEAETRARAFKKARRKRDEDPVDIVETDDDE